MAKKNSAGGSAATVEKGKNTGGAGADTKKRKKKKKGAGSAGAGGAGEAGGKGAKKKGAKGASASAAASNPAAPDAQAVIEPKNLWLSSKPATFRKLARTMHGIAVVDSVKATLGWDQETMLPAAGAELRAGQMEALSRLAHEMRTAGKVGKQIEACEDDKAVKRDAELRACVRECRRDYDQAMRLPGDLVAEIARVTSLATDHWKEARKKSDFKALLPWLREIIGLMQQKADCLRDVKAAKGKGSNGKGAGGKSGGKSGGCERYDALLDLYEPGMTAAQTEAIFKPLRAALVPLIERVAASTNRPDVSVVRRAIPIEAQKKFVRAVAEKIGFDFRGGRLDDSTHPFCESPGPGDTRLTSRYKDDNFADALSTVMHEAGHGMYEQGLPKHDRFGLPLAEAISLGIHESQSRLWENLVGRSRPFWDWAISEARQCFGASFSADPALVHKAVNVIEPHFIRVESDEVTYNMHIMLRFDLERAMVNGEMDPADLPEAWNARMKQDLGLTVTEDRLGCLQDIHWTSGLVGYFPTYTFGNLYAAQFWEKIGEAIPDRDARMARGDFAPILQWLRDNIHAHGKRYRAGELCELITGKPLAQDALVRHLNAKARVVYGV